MAEASSINAELVRRLPQSLLRTRLRSPRGVTEYEFKGALLYDYARECRLLDAVSGSDPAACYFLASAADGFRAAIAFGEVLPHFSSKQVLLAWEQNGEPIRTGIRLVVPGDDLGGRSLFGLASLEVKGIDRVPPATTDGPSWWLSIQGLVERPQRLDVRALGSLPQLAIEAEPRRDHAHQPRRRYSGTALYTLLEVAGIRLDPAVNEDFLRKVVVAQGRDGYRAVIAGGELEPRFMNGRALVSGSTGDEALRPDEGGLRLVVPYDEAIGRSVKGLVSVELIEA